LTSTPILGPSFNTSFFICRAARKDLLNYFPQPKLTSSWIPAIIQFGALVGTYSATPVENKGWFLIGMSDLLTMPAEGKQLFLAVKDERGKSYNNGAS
jgi:hypothetical protein